jgi:transposase-like protein
MDIVVISYFKIALAFAVINIPFNGIEGFWSYAKTWLYHYRGVPKQYFHMYLKEIEFRFNHRNEDLFRLLANTMVKTVPNV